MKISTSKGITEFDTTEVKSVEELAIKACSLNISTSTFNKGYRNVQNFISAECIGLDIDNDKDGTATLSLDQAKRTFAEFKHVILSTRNHNVEKNGVTAERFRVILFPEYPITKSNDFYCTWFWLKDQFPWIDNQCKDPSRFWYQHKEVLSISEKGKLITPIRYTEPEKPLKDGRDVLPGERGELSKDVLKFLEFGVKAGSRNGTVYKVAREFQQALYEHSETEARILGSLERNEILSSDFTEAEAKLAIGSAFTKDAKHAPRLAEVKARAFSYLKWSDLLAKPDRQDDWIIDGLLIRGGMSIVVGVPKIGKTTFVRQMEKSILRGQPFLNRNTKPGSIVHYSFDEKAITAKRHYVRLGLDKDDPMVLHFGTAGNANYLKELEEDLLTIKPTLAVVDTMFDMVDVQDVNSYGPIKRALSFFSTLAEKTNCHIMFIHHQNKPNQNYSQGSGNSVLGSQAIYGSVDACMIFEKDPSSQLRVLNVTGRAVDDFKRTYLAFDKVSMTYSITTKSEVDF